MIQVIFNVVPKKTAKLIGKILVRAALFSLVLVAWLNLVAKAPLDGSVVEFESKYGVSDPVTVCNRVFGYIDDRVGTSGLLSARERNHHQVAGFNSCAYASMSSPNLYTKIASARAKVFANFIDSLTDEEIKEHQNKGCKVAFEFHKKDRNAKALWATCLYYGSGSVPKDRATALQHYKQASSEGSAVASYMLGAAAEHGVWTPANREAARVFYAEAVSRGFIEASVALLMLDSSTPFAPDPGLLSSLYSTYKLGSSSAANWLGIYSMLGLNVAKDLEQAIFFFKESRAFHPNSKSNLGILLYSKHNAEEKDYLKAIELLKSAARTGVVSSYYHLATIFENLGFSGFSPATAQMYMIKYLSEQSLKVEVDSICLTWDGETYNRNAPFKIYNSAFNTDPITKADDEMYRDFGCRISDSSRVKLENIREQADQEGTSLMNFVSANMSQIKPLLRKDTIAQGDHEN